MINDFNPENTFIHKISRKAYAQDDEWIRKFLRKAEIGHIATRWETQPFITPNLFWYDEERHQIIFHTSMIGRVIANVEHHTEACFEACQVGKLLPSNDACEFGLQYESVVAFGKIGILEEVEDKRRALYGLLNKYFPQMKPGKEYRPISDKELSRTAVLSIAIDSWSGKRNWSLSAKQTKDWPALREEYFRSDDHIAR